MNETILSIGDVELLLAAMKKHDNRPAIVDWTNQQIVILSEVHPVIRNGKQLMLSNGPAYGQDYLFHLKG